MSQERLPMKKIREILRMSEQLKMSSRAIGGSLGISHTGVDKGLERARAAGVDWEVASGHSDESLYALLYGARKKGERADLRSEPDCGAIHLERQKNRHVTLNLLHLEYLQRNPKGLKYTAFCNRYRQWLQKQRLSMTQAYKGGEKLFIDYSGKKAHYTDEVSREPVWVELFVAVLGASNFTYAEASVSQKTENFVASHISAFEYFGGATRLLVPDQLKSAVVQASAYEAGISSAYSELASHYGAAVLPARPRRPKDKAKVEGAVLIVQRWILARLRHETHYSLGSLNERVRELLEELNDRPMRRYGGKSRRQLFEELERQALLPLPEHRFEFGERKWAKVHIDYHVELEKHRYSVPCRHVGEKVELRLTATLVEVFLHGERIASHLRSYRAGGFTTLEAHMPAAHRGHAHWTPERMLNWVGTIGPNTTAYVEAMFEVRRHPEVTYRAVLGIMQLSKGFGKERLENAAKRCLPFGGKSYSSLKRILEAGLDSVPLESSSSAQVAHENVRGANYYH